jgi:hypothetical protein
MSEEEVRRPAAVRITDTITIIGKLCHVAYILTVDYDEENSWVLSHRFSEFVTLKSTLESKCLMNANTLPHLPKTIPLFGSDIEPTFVQERRLRLQRFLDECLRHDVIYKTVWFARFIGVNDEPDSKTGSCPPVESSYTQHSEFFDVTQPMLGVTDTLMNGNSGHFITVTQDSSMISRFDSWITNYKLPFEDPSNSIIAVGSVNSWLRDLKTNKWLRVDVLYYEEGVTCVTRLPGTEQIVFGLANGRLLKYEIQPDFKLRGIAELKVIHKTTMRKLMTTDNGMMWALSANAISAEVISPVSTKYQFTTRDHEFTDMALSTAQNILFVSTTKGLLLCFRVPSANQPLMLVHTLGGQAPDNKTIHALSLSSQPPMLYTAGESGTSLWELESGTDSVGEPTFLLGGSKLGRRIPCPPGASSAHCILIADNMLFIGYSNGIVGVYRSNEAELIKLIHPASPTRGPVKTLQWNSEAKLLGVGGDSGMMHVWRFPGCNMEVLSTPPIPPLPPSLPDSLPPLPLTGPPLEQPDEKGSNAMVENLSRAQKRRAAKKQAMKENASDVKESASVE